MNLDVMFVPLRAVWSVLDVWLLAAMWLFAASVGLAFWLGVRVGRGHLREWDS